MNRVDSVIEDSNPLMVLGVSPELYRQFQRNMETCPVHVVTKSGGYGAFDMRPRRLVEMGFARKLRDARLGRRTISKCEFRPPWSEHRFLHDPLAQVAAFRASMRDYASQILRHDIDVPAGCSLAGVLAILHVGGRGALKSFPNLFSDTKRRYDAVKELF